jgi:hypothetical protein
MPGHIVTLTLPLDLSQVLLAKYTQCNVRCCQRTHQAYPSPPSAAAMKSWYAVTGSDGMPLQAQQKANMGQHALGLLPCSPNARHAHQPGAPYIGTLYVHHQRQDTCVSHLNDAHLVRMLSPTCPAAVCSLSAAVSSCLRVSLHQHRAPNSPATLPCWHG